MTTNQKAGRIQDVDSGFWDSSIVYGQMLEILIVHPDDAVDTLLLENKEQRGALAIMGNMILSKHLEHIWPSTHRLRGPSSKSRSGMQ